MATKAKISPSQTRSIRFGRILGCAVGCLAAASSCKGKGGEAKQVPEESGHLIRSFVGALEKMDAAKYLATLDPKRFHYRGKLISTDDRSYSFDFLAEREAVSSAFSEGIYSQPPAVRLISSGGDGFVLSVDVAYEDGVASGDSRFQLRINATTRLRVTTGHLDGGDGSLIEEITEEFQDLSSKVPRASFGLVKYLHGGLFDLETGVKDEEVDGGRKRTYRYKITDHASRNSMFTIDAFDTLIPGSQSGVGVHGASMLDSHGNVVSGVESN